MLRHHTLERQSGSMAWSFAAPGALPLTLWRGLVGVCICVLAVNMEATSSVTVEWAVPDRVAVDLESETRSVFDLPAAEQCPLCTQAIVVAAGFCVIMGVYPRLASAVGWLVAMGICRRSFPAVEPYSELVAMLCFWCVLLVRPHSDRRRPTRPSHLVLGAFLVSTTMRIIDSGGQDAAAVLLGCTACLLGVWALWSTIATRAPRMLDLSVVMSVVALLCGPGATAAQVVSPAPARALRSLAWDLGLLHTSPPPVRAVEVEMRTGGSRSSAEEVRRRLERLDRVQYYLGSLGAEQVPLAMTDRQRVRLHGAVRQRLANHVCAAWLELGVVDVFIDGLAAPIQSFYCHAGRGRLVPRAAERVAARVRPGTSSAKVQVDDRSIHTLASDEGSIARYLDNDRGDRRRRLRQLVTVAGIRYDAREFDEAVRLLEQAYATANESERQSANLLHLITMVRNAAQQ